MRITENLVNILRGNKCCGKRQGEKIQGMKKIAIVGSPNVGKSVLFNKLTRLYVTVSNYPGTTVEVSRGRAKFSGLECEIIDTPGMYSFSPISEEERVARRILIEERPALVLHVIEAKSLERMLPLTLQLCETRLPTILVVNILDEAEKEGVDVDIASLATELSIPVVGTVSTRGKGIDILKQRIIEEVLAKRDTLKPPVVYPDNIEMALARLEGLLTQDYTLSKRAIALLLLRDDDEIKEIFEKKESPVVAQIEEIVGTAKSHYVHRLEYEIALALQQKASYIASKVVKLKKESITFREKLSRLMINPITGIIILFFVLYWGLYKFVGVFGAGTVVDFLEGNIFEKQINPFITNIFTRILPWRVLEELFVGEYGVITLGLRYALALILPIVTFFFIVFSIIEDSGYLPRLALLIDRTFKMIGLSGRAVIPMVLGFGCDTMATMVTRTLPTKRERIIATMLLALAVPCSAQMGVILALLSGNPKALFIWAGVVGLVFLFIGFLTAKVLPGERPSFYMELPPLRFPQLSNVLIKTFVRVKWYFREVLPLFLLASVFIWIGQLMHIFDLIINLLKKPMQLIALPPEAAKIFLFGFFRRDYGAAGLYDLNKQGGLSGVQLVVACVALTLFLPCIAQFLMNVKERGWKTGLSISAFILVFSFSVAFILNLILRSVGVSL